MRPPLSAESSSSSSSSSVAVVVVPWTNPTVTVAIVGFDLLTGEDEIEYYLFFIGATVARYCPRDNIRTLGNAVPLGNAVTI